ncbi:YkvA family protein [Salinicola sp. DM10]|uniref:YkvA family protein n=1 Tax=Salinicola sp. DM10 TaxID=2815721 RepID=UPI00351D20F1
MAVWLAARDPRTPWWARGLALVVAAYAVSPIDLIPDVIPVLGYLDDVVLVPLGIWLVLKGIPPNVMNECRRLADERVERPVSHLAAAVFITLWFTAAVAVCRFCYSMGWLG